MTKKELMYQRITKHGEQLKVVFALRPDVDPVKLCKQLFGIENAVRQIMVNMNNANNVGGIPPSIENNWLNHETTDDELEAVLEKYHAKLKKILGDFSSLVHFNHDPRGYALKISDNLMQKNGLRLYQDFGGNGIIAPDFRN